MAHRYINHPKVIPLVMMETLSLTATENGRDATAANDGWFQINNSVIKRAK